VAALSGGGRQPLRVRGPGGAEVLAGPEARRESVRKEVREVALGELGTDIGAVARRFEQVRVGVEGHACAGVAEDAADLDDVEANVDDQVAGKGVAQVVEPDPPAVAIETGRRRRGVERASRRCGGETACRGRWRTRSPSPL
jgi:hypothetical protein